MKHPSWANYIVLSNGREFYLSELSPGYKYRSISPFGWDDGDFLVSKLQGGSILANMISYEFIGEEEN